MPHSNTSTQRFDETLDTSGLLCPEPVMLLHKKMRDTKVGCIVRLMSTDPSTLRDVPKFCQFLKHELIDKEENEQCYVYYIKKVAT